MHNETGRLELAEFANWAGSRHSGLSARYGFDPVSSQARADPASSVPQFDPLRDPAQRHSCISRGL